MKFIKTIRIAPLLAALAVFSLSSCEKKTPAEEAADDMSDAIEDAGDDIGDAIKDATN